MSYTHTHVRTYSILIGKIWNSVLLCCECWPGLLLVCDMQPEHPSTSVYSSPGSSSYPHMEPRGWDRRWAGFWLKTEMERWEFRLIQKHWYVKCDCQHHILIYWVAGAVQWRFPCGKCNRVFCYRRCFPTLRLLQHSGLHSSVQAVMRGDLVETSTHEMFDFYIKWQTFLALTSRA